MKKNQIPKDVKNYMASVVSALPSAVIVSDLRGDVVVSNDRAREILGRDRDEIINTPVAELFYSAGEFESTNAQLSKAEGGKLMGVETSMRDRNGKEVAVRLSVTELRDGEGDHVGRVDCFDEIRQLERGLLLLLKASNFISQAENLREGMERLAEMITSLLSSTFCRILLLDEGGECLIASAAYHTRRGNGSFKWKDRLGEKTSIDKWPGLRGRLKGGKPTVLAIGDKEVSGNLLMLTERLGLDRPIQSLLSVPLTANGKIIGLLHVGEVRNEERQMFRQDKVELAAAIAAHVAALIDSRRLKETTDRNNHLLAALNEASLHIRAEKEQHKLLKEVVRLAVDLVRCDVGALFVYNYMMKKLELATSYGFDGRLFKDPLPYDDNVIGSVICKGAPQVTDRESAPGDVVLSALGLETVIAIPLKEAGATEAVLLIGDRKGDRQFAASDIDILVQFALHTSIALRTSELIAQEQHRLSQFNVLISIIQYIQTETDWDKILHIMLTGVTAGFGLGFNRAALFLLEENSNYLTGRMGIGQVTEQEAFRSWEEITDKGLYDFQLYLDELNKPERPPQTSISKRVCDLRLPVNMEGSDAFSLAMSDRTWQMVRPEDSGRLPEAFVEAFEPESPVIIVPLQTRNHVIGLVAADNKFTRSPITEEDIRLLMTFVAAAAIAGDMEGQRLRSYFEASNALVLSEDPQQAVQDIVDQMRETAKASWVSLVLIDDTDKAHSVVASGTTETVNASNVMRSNGISLAVKQVAKPRTIEDASRQRGEINEIMLRGGKTKAALCLPVVIRDRCIGVMWFLYDEPRHFPKFEIDALQFYVTQAAIAYINAQQIMTLKHLGKFAQSLASSTEPRKVLEQIILGAKLVLNADSATIWSYDASKDKFLLEHSDVSGIPDEHAARMNRITPSRQGTAYTVMQRGWVGVRDVNDSRNYEFIGPATRKILNSLGAKSFQGIALKAGDEKLGVLYVNYNTPRGFDDGDKKAAQAFADHAALALKNARLVDQITRAKTTVELAHAMVEVVARAMVLGDHELTLDAIVQGTRGVLNCDAVVLFTYDQSSGRLQHPPTMVGVRFPDKARATEEKLSGSIVHQVLKRDQPYTAEDVENDPIFKDKRFAIDEGIKSCIAVPLSAASQKVGVMFVNYRSPHTFTPEERANVELFANYAAVAIHNAQLLLEQSRRITEQGTLAELSQSILNTVSFDNLQQTLDRSVAEAAAMLGTEYSNIVLDDGGELIFSTAYGWPRSMVGDFRLKKGRGSQTGYTIEVGQHVIVPDYEEERRFTVPGVVKQRRIKSGLSVPIFRAGEIVGAMLVHTTSTRQFTDADVRLLSLIANQVAMLLSMAQHYEQMQQHNANLLAAYDAGKALASLRAGLERKQVLDSILGQAVKCISRKRGRKVVLGTIQLYNEERQELVFESVYPSEHSENYAQVGQRWSIAQRQSDGERVGVTGRAVLERVPQLVARVRDDKDYIKYNETTKSELAVPLLDGDGKVIGVLDLESEQEGVFDEGDKEALKLLAELAVIAIRSAQQIKELQQEKATSVAKDALVWMGMSSSYWRHTIQNNAITIRDKVEFIDRMAAARPIGEIKNRLAEISDLAKMIANYPISEELSSQELGEVENVNALLRRRVIQLQEFSPEEYSSVSIKFDLRLENDAKVRANSNWLIRALDVLFDNAIRAMEHSRDKVLVVGTRRCEGAVVIEITDTGRGIPERLKPKILAQPIKHSRDEKRLGMGLLMAQFIVKVYEGRIEVVSSDGAGTKMAVYLPLAEQQ
ncbi:MAG: GAF domain-containing protein [Blastocatellia bacterium]